MNSPALRPAHTALCALALAVACGDPPPAGVDSGPAADAGAAVDSGSATDGGSPADAGSVQCFPLSGPSADLPDAIPSEFTAGDPTWMRPTGEACPAAGVGAEAVPFQTVCYENDTGADLDVFFETVVEDDSLDPIVVIYDGRSIPTDPTQCAAVSSDLVIDVAEASYTVPAGGFVTFVAGLQSPGAGSFQFVITPE